MYAFDPRSVRTHSGDKMALRAVLLQVFAFFAIIAMAAAQAGASPSRAPSGQSGRSARAQVRNRSHLLPPRPVGSLLTADRSSPAATPSSPHPLPSTITTAAPSRKLLQGWPEPPITVNTPSGPGVIRRYPVSVQNIVGGNILLPNFVQRGRGSGK